MTASTAQVPATNQDETGALVQGVTGSHGVQLYSRTWSPELQPPKASLLMMHGLTWHSKYFQDAAHFFNRSGFQVVTFDHPAHGLSGSSHGVRAYHPSEEGYLANVLTMARVAAGSCPPGTPQFAYGESFGGAVLLKAAASQPALRALLAGIVVVGTPAGPPATLPPKPVVAVLRALASAFPLLPMPPDKTTERDNWVGAFGDQQLAAHAFDHDPLVIKSLPLGTLGVALPLVLGVPECLPAVTTPTLVLHGEADTRVPCAQAQLVHERLGARSKQLRVYPGLKHQLLQELPAEWEKVLGDVLEWMQGIVKG